MIIWVIAALTVACVGIVGFYQGAVRAAFSTLGLIVATFFALPFGGLFQLLLPVFGLEHPVLLEMLSPIIAFLVVLIAFKIGGFVVHRKLDTFYKYQGSDTRKLLFERMNQRVGIGVGMVNASIYVFLICVVLHVIGYSTIQFGGGKTDHFAMKTVNFLAAGLEDSGMSKAIAPFNPAPKSYYDGADILGDIFRTPLLQSRLSTYPPFLPLAERSEFKTIGGDGTFQEFWQRGPEIREFSTHERMAPMIKNTQLFKELTELVGSDLPDLKGYLMTGESAKYADEKILGRWKFSITASKDRAKARKANMNFAERKKLSLYLRANFTDAVLTGFLDGKIEVKGPAGDFKGTWKRIRAGKYSLTTPQGETDATIDGETLSFIQREIPLVFKKR